MRRKRSPRKKTIGSEIPGKERSCANRKAQRQRVGTERNGVEQVYLIKMFLRTPRVSLRSARRMRRGEGQSLLI